MIDRGRSTRRALLATLGAGIAAPAIAGCVAGDGQWVAVDVPTDATLDDAVTAAGGTYAVGESGVILGRADDGSWTVRRADGIGGAENALRSAAATSAGRAIWAAGDSGALGYYDVVADRVVDFSAPEEKTSSWSAIAVAGLAGNERLVVVNTSGELLAGRRDGATVEWAEVVEPGSGSTLADIDLTGVADVYAVDTEGSVFESPDSGRSWTRIGIADADVDLATVSAVDDGHVSVGGGNGFVFSYDGVDWTRSTLGEQPIGALVRDRYDSLAVSIEGAVYERKYGDWHELARLHPGDEPRAITLGTARSPPVIVGESGTVFERRF